MWSRKLMEQFKRLHHYVCPRKEPKKWNTIAPPTTYYFINIFKTIIHSSDHQRYIVIYIYMKSLYRAFKTAYLRQPSHGGDGTPQIEDFLMICDGIVQEGHIYINFDVRERLHNFDIPPEQADDLFQKYFVRPPNSKTIIRISDINAVVDALRDTRTFESLKILHRASSSAKWYVRERNIVACSIHNERTQVKVQRADKQGWVKTQSELEEVVPDEEERKLYIQTKLGNFVKKTGPLYGEVLAELAAAFGVDPTTLQPYFQNNRNFMSFDISNLERLREWSLPRAQPVTSLPV
jgi:hypothetical protein